MLLLLIGCNKALATPTDSIESGKATVWRYIPTFHGTFRVSYQLSTATGMSRFGVQNARLSAGGFVLPHVDYLLQVDFSDRGRIVLLDAYLRATPAPGLKIMAGQMRVPFSVSASRAPHLYYFTDVELPAVFGNLRSTGVKAGYTIPRTQLYFEGGVFNATDRKDHSVWNSALTYGIKANAKFAGFKPELAFMSRVPAGQGVRVNMYNASLSWSAGNFFTEAEYIYRDYAGCGVQSSHAWSIFVDYARDVRWKWAQNISVQARFDGLTDGSDCQTIVDGVPVFNIAGRRRVTVGTTAKYSFKKTLLAFRLNFEQYFYSHNVNNISASDNDKLVAGLMLYF